MARHTKFRQSKYIDIMQQLCRYIADTYCVTYPVISHQGKIYISQLVELHNLTFERLKQKVLQYWQLNNYDTLEAVLRAIYLDTLEKATAKKKRQSKIQDTEAAAQKRAEKILRLRSRHDGHI